ncbi:glycosyltransferase [Bradyrhizobium sp. ORS 111]|uniref:CgeB family protein n=1 Tax=Bradyrhizobium sp. ORS 111 TaxID=1685958 RepID=UPI00389110CF
MMLDIVVIGLSVTSAWGNGHATTYRALIGALAQRGHRVTFLERHADWYRDHRDLEEPLSWSIEVYGTLREIPLRFGTLIRNADLVVLGSYVPEGVAIADWVTTHARGITAFYDIDTPVTIAGLDRGLQYLSAAMIPRFDLYLTFAGGPIPKMLEVRYGSPLARELPCSADVSVDRTQLSTPKWTLGYLGTYSDDRQPALEQLLLEPARVLPDSRFVVAGSKYPPLTWPSNVERIEHVAPVHHQAFYSRQRFALNVTRADMRALGFSPSVRLFEAAACGTPIVSDRWPGIEMLLKPSTEILLVSNTRDVLDILREMPDDRRRSIGERARQRILAEHTPAHRARQLESYYLEATMRRRQRATDNSIDRSAQVADF